MTSLPKRRGNNRKWDRRECDWRASSRALRATHQAVCDLHGLGTYLREATFSPDATRLVLGSGDLTVRIWDSRSHQ